MIHTSLISWYCPRRA